MLFFEKRAERAVSMDGPIFRPFAFVVLAATIGAAVAAAITAYSYQKSLELFGAKDSVGRYVLMNELPYQVAGIFIQMLLEPVLIGALIAALTRRRLSTRAGIRVVAYASVFRPLGIVGLVLWGGFIYQSLARRPDVTDRPGMIAFAAAGVVLALGAAGLLLP